MKPEPLTEPLTANECDSVGFTYAMSGVPVGQMIVNILLGIGNLESWQWDAIVSGHVAGLAAKKEQDDYDRARETPEPVEEEESEMPF